MPLTGLTENDSALLTMSWHLPASLLLRLIQRRYEKTRLILTSALHVVSKDTPVLLLEWRVIHRYDDMSHIYLNQDTFDLNTQIMV